MSVAFPSTRRVHRTGTVVIGAGQAGLAVSQCLTDREHDHVVLDRGRIAERWRSERWDSLRLLTPNWMTRLPGYSYDGPDPDGFMTARETVEFFADYASTFAAPVVEHTEVLGVSHDGQLFTVTSTGGAFVARNVIVATGWNDRPLVPAAANSLSPDVDQVVPSEYRKPSQLADGGVLVVGASATGLQIAHELRLSGRDVVLAVGRHQRIPRSYRGMDSFWWLDQLGLFDRTVEDITDVWAERIEPSLQLVGRPDHLTLDLTTLQALGVAIAGRVGATNGSRVTFEPGVDALISASDQRLHELLGRIDTEIDKRGLAAEVLPADRPRAVPSPAAIESIDLRRAGIGTVVWATGYRREYRWLQLPILDRRGEIRQHRGVTDLPGAYVLGQRFQHFRNSNFIDGVGRDAAFVAEHIVCRGRSARRPHLSEGAHS